MIKQYEIWVSMDLDFHQVCCTNPDFKNGDNIIMFDILGHHVESTIDNSGLKKLGSSPYELGLRLGRYGKYRTLIKNELPDFVVGYTIAYNLGIDMDGDIIYAAKTSSDDSDKFVSLKEHHGVKFPTFI